MFTSPLSLSPRHGIRLVPFGLVALLTLLAVPTFALDKENRGFGLDRAFAVTGAYGFGKREGVAGQSFLVRAEGAGYFMSTPMHNRGGIEGGMELGYDGFDHDPNAVLGGFLWDFWLGFPVTLFEKFDDDGILLTTALSPGLGIGSQHTYVYIKGKIAARVVPRVAMELNYQWTPYNGSLAWMNTPGDHAGLAMAVLRYTTYFAVTEETSLMLYFDWRQSNLDSPMPGSDPALAAFDAKNGIYNSGAFSPIFRTRVDNNFRIGFGVAF